MIEGELFAYKGLWNCGPLIFTTAIKYRDGLYTNDPLGIKISTIEKIFPKEQFTNKEVELNGRFGTTSSSYYVIKNTPYIGVNWKQGTKNCPCFFQDINKLKFL
jgi:hypothetical protein